MVKNWLFTGDTHGKVAERLAYIKQCRPELDPAETAIIILGDVGLNYYLSKTDYKNKIKASSFEYTIYCVHGNHEARPGESLSMKLINDELVGGPVWIDEEFPLIRYFTTWGIYNICGHKTLVIGGAYSVDKHYRIQNGWRWFEDEQLADHERAACLRSVKDQNFDLVLSHTCPYEWRPTDLFLCCIDQSTVDNTMELWLDTVRNAIGYNRWFFGHYHGDRIERPGVEMFYTEVEDLNTIEERWSRYEKTNELDWWLPKSPNFYM